MTRPTHLFLDTNVLDQSWPELSLKVSNIVEIAQKLRISVEIPAPVLVELRKHRRERVKKDLDTVRKTIENWRAVLGTSVADPCPKFADLVSAYEAYERNLLSTREIVVTPFPMMSIEHFFERATLKQALFGESGANFQDNVILQGALEQLVPKNGKGMILTEDKHFHGQKEEIDRLSGAANVELTCAKLEDAESKLVGLLEHAERDRYLHYKEIATRAVRSYLPEFQSLFNRYLELSDLAQWDEFLPRTCIKNAHFDEVADVDVPQWKADPPAGTELSLSAIVRGTATAETRYSAGSGDVRSHTRREIFEVGFNASATFDGSEYSLKWVSGWTHGRPGSVGAVGHADLVT